MKTIFLIVVFYCSIMLGFAQTWSAVTTGTNGRINALHATVTHLYIGGSFSLAGGNNAMNIARYNGTIWDTLSGGVSSNVNAISTFNGDIHAAGIFFKGVEKWDGNFWSVVGSGLMFPGIGAALCEYAGELYAGGDFLTAGGVNVHNIGRWNGSSWSPTTTTGMNNPVICLAVYNNELYAGGSFATANNITVNYVAKWDGTNWSPLGSGMNARILSLGVYNGELYAGGWFTMAGGTTANYIAKWNGTSWSAVGSGMDTTVHSLAVYNGELYAGGLFSTAGGNTANHIAKWNGTNWSSVGTGTDTTVLALAVYDGSLFAGGMFTVAGGLSANYIAKWTDTTTSINEFEKDKLKLYPNPVFGVLNIENKLSADIEKIELTDVSGKQMKIKQDLNTKNQVDLGNLDNGVYFIRLYTSEGILTERVVIQN